MSYPKCPACAHANAKFMRKRVGRLSIIECKSCGLVFTDPLLNGSANDVGTAKSSVTDSCYYEGIVTKHAAQLSLAAPKVRRLLEDYERRFNFLPKRVLEIGCGTGAYADAWIGEGVAWQGVEASPMMLEFCEAHGKPVIAAERLAILQPDSFDLIYFSQVLEHVLDPVPFLRQVRGLVSSGGIVHLDVPNHDALTSRFRRANPWSKDFGFIQPPHHLIAYRACSLKALISGNGFEIEMLEAVPNNNVTYGQLMVEPGKLHRFIMGIDAALGTGALLVCIARAI